MSAMYLAAFHLIRWLPKGTTWLKKSEQRLEIFWQRLFGCYSSAKVVVVILLLI